MEYIELVKKQNRRLNKRSLWLIFIVVVALYGQTLWFGWSGFDDTTIITEQADFWESNPKLLPFFTWQDPDYPELYRPLQNVSYALDIKLGGGKIDSSVWAFHLTNVLLFALICMTLFVLLVSQGISRGLALFLTVLFACHPLLSKSVAWIPARGDLMLTLFCMLCFVHFDSFLKKDNRWQWSLLWCSLFFGLSLFAKETAVMLPILLLIWYWLKVPKEKILQGQHILLACVLMTMSMLWLVLWAIAGADGVVTSGVNCGDSCTLCLEKNGNLPIEILRNFQMFPTMVGQFLLPFDFNPIPKFSVLKTSFGSMVMLMLIVCVFLKKENKGVMWLALLWFILFLLPAMPAVLKYFENTYFNHRFLLPAVGIVWLVAMLLNGRLWLKKLWVKALGMLVIVAFALLSFFLSQNFKSSETLSKATDKYGNTLLVPERSHDKEYHKVIK